MLLLVLVFVYAWCLIIPVDSLSISLGGYMGLSITLKPEVEQLRWLWGGGGPSSMVRAPEAKAGDLGSIPSSCLGFLFSSWPTN